jgi:A/G-specific adenine glycosylase
MLQQTRIAAVLPFYDRFLENLPTVEALAAARPERVLRMWSGLGYYSRARNLHRAAREIVAKHGGRFPRTLEQALALPGIGRYTAAAILSIAYEVPLAALDGNVARVLARLGGIRGDLRAPRQWRQLERIAEFLLAREAPGDWNQALMELGETICTPRNPICEACPVSRICRARSMRLTQEIPAARSKRAPVSVKIAAGILLDPRRRTVLVRDPGAPDGVLFSRMWQFPAVEIRYEARVELEKHLREILRLDSTPLHLEPLPAVRHGVTFRNITLLPFVVQAAKLPRLARTRVLAFDRIAQLPVSSATRKIAAAAQLYTTGPGPSRIGNAATADLPGQSPGPTFTSAPRSERQRPGGC